MLEAMLPNSFGGITWGALLTRAGPYDDPVTGEYHTKSGLRRLILVQTKKKNNTSDQMLCG